MQIRLLGPQDGTLVENACHLFGVVGEIDVDAFLRRRETSLLVAEDDDGIAGWVYGHELVHPDGERTMLLYSLDVAEQARRRGFARSLVTAFVDHAKHIGCTEVWVLTDDANPATLTTYTSANGRRDPVDQVMFTWHLRDGRHS